MHVIIGLNAWRESFLVMLRSIGVAMFFRIKKPGARADVQVVENYAVVTSQGKQLPHRIGQHVRVRVDCFTRQLTQDAREAAISIVMFYFGISLNAGKGTPA